MWQLKKKRKPDWNKIKRCIGHFGGDIDPVEWQRQIRDEWER